MTHFYGLFKALNNILPPASVETIIVVGCGPRTDHDELDGLLHNCPNATIWGFEPCPENFEGLRQKHSGNPRVKLFDMAVADFDGTGKFHINHPIGAHSLLPWNDESVYKPESWITRETVNTVVCKLDTFCNDIGINHVDLLFMDAQGAESLVVQGATELIHSRRINAIVGEAIFTDIYGDPHSFADVYNVLARTGLYEFRGFYRLNYGKTGKLHHCDYMFVRGK